MYCVHLIHSLRDNCTLFLHPQLEPISYLCLHVYDYVKMSDGSQRFLQTVSGLCTLHLYRCLINESFDSNFQSPVSQENTQRTDYSPVLGVLRVNTPTSNGPGPVLHVVIGCPLRNPGLSAQHSARVSNLVDLKSHPELS